MSNLINFAVRHIFYSLCVVSLLASCSGKDSEDRNALKTEFSLEESTRAVKGLIDRVTGGRSSEFKVVVTGVQEDGKDWFAVSSEGGKVLLEGNDGISVASALNLYLKRWCGWHDSWCGTSYGLPGVLPLPQERVERTSPYKYRYNLNYCTFNYSMSWWDFDRWQQEIDRMAMNGINMPLAVTGQNSVWQRVYRKLGFTDGELEGFFSGPAYFNWFWMGNLDAWGGPLPQSFMDAHERLQKKILYAERSLGMTPVLPAFTGHIPPSFETRFPDVKVRKTSWVNFPEVSILDPEEEMFTRIGQMFLEEQTALYGTNHYYTADTFNENLPPLADSLYLDAISSKVYEGMSSVDSSAVWVMQGWLFHHKRKFWSDDRIQALLNAVPDDNMLILDLWSERYPVWSRTHAYYGKPWIWCMLHNFGQNITLSGNVTAVANDPAAALHDPSSGRMSGIGLTMEGIGQNPAMYALMLENVWRDTPVDTDAFLREYLTGRYGTFEEDAFEAWKIIFATAYENDQNNGGPESIITGRPTFRKNPGGTTNTKLHYDNADLLRSWDLLAGLSDRLGESDGFRYDLVDVSRQVLANYASSLQQQAASAFRDRDSLRFSAASSGFITLIEDMDRLLGTREEFLLGKWLEDAGKMGGNAEEKALYEKNARNLLTLWGGPDCRIRDYACRQWSGLMDGYYKQRWSMFFSEASRILNEGGDWNQDAFDAECKEWEWDWVNATGEYGYVPEGDSLSECEYVYRKYRALVEQASVILSEGDDKEMI
ncbi:MAG: alpha-N-acetylglucosaminidase [Candidatus Cryptobacteroides sp.]